MTTQTATIKKGTLVLPQELWINWQETDVIIKPQTETRIMIEKLPLKKQNMLAMWKKMAGILKNRKLPNPIVWQNQIRKEWER